MIGTCRDIVTTLTVYGDNAEIAAEIDHVVDYMIAVELDGHDFHERTKEQVTYRNQRDRLLQAAGWAVFHFSGSELYRGQMECVVAVAELARQRHEAAELERAKRAEG